jgi:hypothetical protein
MASRVPEIRCPRLGHEVPLAYCYHMPEGRPCGRLFHCWEGLLPRLRDVVARHIPEERWAQYFDSPPPHKTLTLVELIQKAKGGSENGPRE